MRKWFLIFMMAALLALPSLAFAQTDLTLTNVEVQLWPEYDQRSMLALVDYSVPANTTLPVDLQFRIPKDANLIAVAVYGADGSLLTAETKDSKVEGEWAFFTVTLDSLHGRFEYYQPLTFNGDQRVFSYLWSNSYAVDAFTISVLEPTDVTSLSAEPKLATTTQQQGLNYHSGSPVKLATDEQFTLNLEYTKTTDTLVASAPSPQTVQPVEPLDETTAGRVSLSNSLPYIIGGLGVIMVVGGVFYYWQSGRDNAKKSRSRKHSRSDEDDGSDVYCAQCGTRARGGDRFCRTCGSRLRKQEE
jgi:hypothetical protein